MILYSEDMHVPGPRLALILNYEQFVTLRSIPPTVTRTPPAVSIAVHSFLLFPASYRELNLLYRTLVIIIIHRNELSWQLMPLILQCHGRAEALDYHVMMWRCNLKWWKGQEAVVLPALHKKLQVSGGVLGEPGSSVLSSSGGVCQTLWRLLFQVRRSTGVWLMDLTEECF